jgi:aspartate/methionine/tyrosine aminotransferase
VDLTPVWVPETGGLISRLPSTRPCQASAAQDVRGLPIPANELASRLLEEHGVATLSGTAFGPVGDGHLRISYVSAPEVLQEALERIRAAVAQLS